MTEINQEKKPSYNQRLIQHLEDKKVSKKTIDLIKSFAFEETTRREAEKEATKNIMSWGKYKSRNIEDVYKLDPTYIKWCLKNSQYLSDPQKELMTNLLKAE
jgi:hypothetical protein